MRYRNLVEMQQDCCRRYADRPMYGVRQGDDYGWTTYADFARDVDALRAGLAALGIGRGDAVAIIANNCVEWAVCAYATYGLGARFVAMYESLHAQDRDYILAHSDARLVVVRNASLAAELAARIGSLGQLAHVVAMDEGTGLPSLARVMLAGRQAPVASVHVDAQELASLVYTSGTTGTPKGVTITHGNLMAQIEAVSGIQEVRGDDRSLSILPWGHLMGQIVEVHLLIYLGISAGLLDDVAHLGRDIALVRPSVLFGVPRVFTRIFDGVAQGVAQRGGLARWLYDRSIACAVRRASDAPPVGRWQRLLDRLADRLILRNIRTRLGGRLRFAISGAAALSPEVVRFFDLLGIPIFEGYGLSETTMAVSSNADGARRIGSVGRCLPCAQVRLDTAAWVAGSNEGEIVVYGPCISPGYYKLPQETAAVMTADGGFRTGDIGRIDAEGFLFITGRIKEIYKLENGKYVAPAPLEETLQRSPYVAQVMVYGDNRAFNVAVVVPDLPALRTSAVADCLTQADWCRQPAVTALFQAEMARLGAGFRHFERPERVLVVADEWSPTNGLLTPTLKLKRNRLVQQYHHQIEQLYPH